ncbi:MAG: hypothetical protein J5I50_01390 [Chitinophagaceae bacterium]|nr:hypothetical protein [Chitinophagaceae bacterium]
MKGQTTRRYDALYLRMTLAFIAFGSQRMKEILRFALCLILMQDSIPAKLGDMVASDELLQTMEASRTCKRSVFVAVKDNCREGKQAATLITKQINA